MAIQIAYPDELLTLAGLDQDQFEHLAYEAVLIRLYTLGTISTGKAAAILGGVAARVP